MSNLRNAARELEAQRLLDAWREEPLAEDQTGVDDAAQIRALAGAIRRVPQAPRRRWRWTAIAVPAVLAASAAAASVALVQWGPSDTDRIASTDSTTGGVEVVASNGAQATGGVGSRPLASGEHLGKGASVMVGSADMKLRFPSGSVAVLSAGSELRLEEVGEGPKETLALDVGRVEVDVPPKRGAVEFAVKTSDVRVVVHGTRFIVETSNADPPATTVRVERGVVAVEPFSGPAVRLTAGDSWPPTTTSAVDADAGESDDDTLSTDESSHTKARATPAKPSRVRSTRADRSRRTDRSRRAMRNKSATLAQENRLFAQAMTYKRSEKLSSALRSLERFLRKYPRSVLAQEARIEHFRVLKAMGRDAAAAKSARRYLGQFPQGYARQEARDRVLQQP